MQTNRPDSLTQRSLTATAALLASTLIAATTLSGCLIDTSSHNDISGRYVGSETFAQIQPGKNQEYVAALIGDPSTKTVLDGGTEIWKWTYSERKNSSGSVIFLFSADSHTDSQKTTYVEFKDGVVVKAWRD